MWKITPKLTIFESKEFSSPCKKKLITSIKIAIEEVEVMSVEKTEGKLKTPFDFWRGRSFFKTMSESIFIPSVLVKQVSSTKVITTLSFSKLVETVAGLLKLSCISVSYDSNFET